MAQAAERFRRLGRRLAPEDYNYEHFRARHYLADARATATGRGVRPGELAPEFALPRADDGSWRLSALRTRPVLLHFGSLS